MLCGKRIALKGLAALFLMALLLLLVSPPAGSVARASGEFYQINADDGLHMRAKASDDSRAVKLLKKGTTVKHIASKGNWMYVETKKGTKGFCYKEYLTAKGRPLADPDDEAEYSGELCFVNTVGKTKVYSSDSTTSKVKGRVKGGTVAWLLYYKGNWGYIQTYNTGKTGYVLLGNLTKY